MREEKKVMVCHCDSCDEEVSLENCQSFTYFNPIYAKNETIDLCPKCLKRLFAVLNWRETKEKLVSLNFNQTIETTLGKDGAAAYNEEWTKFGGARKEAGEILVTQFHDYCRTMTPAFDKMRGMYQGVAFPFEIRMKVGDLGEV